LTLPEHKLQQDAQLLQVSKPEQRR